MERLGVQVLGLSVVRWLNSGNKTKDDKSIFYSGKNTGENCHGVGIIINKELQQYVINLILFNESMMLLQIKA